MQKKAELITIGQLQIEGSFCVYVESADNIARKTKPSPGLRAELSMLESGQENT